MSAPCVCAERLSKRFYLLKSHKTAFRTLRSLVTGESLKREHWVLRDLSFEIQRGEKLALVGRNGSGKTTLLRILAGIYESTSGKLLVHSTPRVLLSTTIGLRPDLSVTHNIHLFGAIHGMTRNYLAPRERAILAQAELEHLAYNPLKELSKGQAQRLALAVFAQTPSDFLIFDEVIANVDYGYRLEFESFLDSLVQSDRTLIMTSHDASLLRPFCSRAIWLDGGQIRRIGSVNEVVDEYERSFSTPSTTAEGPVLVRR